MSNINLVKVSGVCAILSGVIWVAANVVGASATPIEAPGDMGEFLLEVNPDRTAFLVSSWLAIIGGIVGLPVAFGFYQALRRWGNILWVGVLALVAGGLFFIAADILRRAFAYKLASRYVEASEATRPALEVMASTIYQTNLVVDLIAHVLFFGIAIGLFSLAILRTSVAPKWVGWFGLFAAVVGGGFSILTMPVIVGWLIVPEPYEAVAITLMAVGMLAAYGWIIVMGVVLLRTRESVALAEQRLVDQRVPLEEVTVPAEATASAD